MEGRRCQLQIFQFFEYLFVLISFYSNMKKYILRDRKTETVLEQKKQNRVKPKSFYTVKIVFYSSSLNDGEFINYETVLFWFKLAMADRGVVEALKRTWHSFTSEFKLKNILQTANKSWEKYKMTVVSMRSKENHVQKISNCGWL